jgi:hypothetical protein
MRAKYKAALFDDLHRKGLISGPIPPVVIHEGGTDTTFPAPTNVMFLFIDGYDADWDTDALQYFLDHGVYVLFLRSHISITTQPNDNGTNELWKVCYGLCMHQFRKTHPGIPLSRMYVNEVIANAYAMMLAHENREHVIIEKPTLIAAIQPLLAIQMAGGNLAEEKEQEDAEDAEDDE